MLYIAGESICTGYWCRTDVNRTVFQGEWMRTGDQYVRGEDGSYTCLGRADDVLKVGGIWVSPTEVESRLLEHPALAEAVVVGVPDEDGLDKPVAYVVARQGASVDPDEVVAFCRAGLAAFKRPRLVIEVDELPKTATGKIQRYRLRQMATATPTPVRDGGRRGRGQGLTVRAPEWIRETPARWDEDKQLTAHGFSPTGVGELRKKVKPRPAA